MITVRFNNNTNMGALKKSVYDNTHRVVLEGIALTDAVTKRNCPVDSGRLRSSYRSDRDWETQWTKSLPGASYDS